MEGGWSTSRSGQFTPGKDPVPIVQEAGWAPGLVLTGAENLAPSNKTASNKTASNKTASNKTACNCSNYGGIFSAVTTAQEGERHMLKRTPCVAIPYSVAV
jgi:hypothetical protein